MTENIKKSLNLDNIILKCKETTTPVSDDTTVLRVAEPAFVYKPDTTFSVQYSSTNCSCCYIHTLDGATIEKNSTYTLKTGEFIIFIKRYTELSYPLPTFNNTYSHIDVISKYDGEVSITSNQDLITNSSSYYGQDIRTGFSYNTETLIDDLFSVASLNEVSENTQISITTPIKNRQLFIGDGSTELRNLTPINIPTDHISVISLYERLFKYLVSMSKLSKKYDDFVKLLLTFYNAQVATGTYTGAGTSSSITPTIEGTIITTPARKITIADSNGETFAPDAVFIYWDDMKFAMHIRQEQRLNEYITDVIFNDTGFQFGHVAPRDGSVYDKNGVTYQYVALKFKQITMEDMPIINRKHYAPSDRTYDLIEVTPTPTETLDSLLKQLVDDTYTFQINIDNEAIYSQYNASAMAIAERIKNEYNMPLYYDVRTNNWYTSDDSWSSNLPQMELREDLPEDDIAMVELREKQAKNNELWEERLNQAKVSNSMRNKQKKSKELKDNKQTSPTSSTTKKIIEATKTSDSTDNRLNLKQAQAIIDDASAPYESFEEALDTILTADKVYESLSDEYKQYVETFEKEQSATISAFNQWLSSTLGQNYSYEQYVTAINTFNSGVYLQLGLTKPMKYSWQPMKGGGGRSFYSPEATIKELSFRDIYGTLYSNLSKPSQQIINDFCIKSNMSEEEILRLIHNDVKVKQLLDMDIKASTSTVTSDIFNRTRLPSPAPSNHYWNRFNT